MKIPRRILLLLFVLISSPAVLIAKPEVRGTVYIDVNKNGRLDSKDRIGKKAKIWLYRIYPDGRRKKVGRVSTDKEGRYTFGKKSAGEYVIAVRLSNRLAVRNSPFVIKGSNQARVSNIPFVTAQTIHRYPFLTRTGNPANLDAEAGTSPFAP